MAQQPASTWTAIGPRAHDIGPGGLVSVNVDADDVRIRGIDGTEARIVAPADGAGIDTVAEPGRFAVRTAGPQRGAFIGIRIGSRGLGIHVSGTIELEVPRDARVEVHSAAGDVALRDVRGDASLRTSAGDVSVKRGGGRVAVGVTSGDIDIEAISPLALEAKSLSGDVEARAPLFERVAIETVSGDAELAGSFAPGARHTISTVSGDVELAVAGGLTLDVQTVSGSVECRHPDRRSGDGRRQPLVIGDGAARLGIRSMSGDVEVRPGPLTPPAPRVETDAAASPASPVEAPAASAAPAAEPAPDPATLAILEALANGDIDVPEAERRLAAAPDGSIHGTRAAAPEAATADGGEAATRSEASLRAEEASDA